MTTNTLQPKGFPMPPVTFTETDAALADTVTAEVERRVAAVTQALPEHVTHAVFLFHKDVTDGPISVSANMTSDELVDRLEAWVCAHRVERARQQRAEAAPAAGLDVPDRLPAASWPHPVGTPVVVTLDDGQRMHTKTRSEAWDVYSGDKPIGLVLIEGRSGGYSLARVHLDEASQDPAVRLDVAAEVGRPTGEFLTVVK